MDIQKLSGLNDAWRRSAAKTPAATEPQGDPVDMKVDGNAAPPPSTDLAKMKAAMTSQPPDEVKLEDRLDDLFQRAQQSPNPVISSLEPLIRNSHHVKIDYPKLREWADNLTEKQLQPANWKFPNYIDEDSPKTIDFFMLANSINFMFFDPQSGEKYKTDFHGKELSGADAMVGSIKRAMEEGIPILDADYLSTITSKDMKHIFRGNMELPLLPERTKIFREVGRVLKKKYDGHFSNLAEQAGYKAFDKGNGMVERLVRDFPSFRDESTHQETGKSLIFDKRAQLAVGMLYSRLAGTGLFECPDVGDLTVFADYQLPRGLRTMGILKYDEALADKVDTHKGIEKDSSMEQELRATTIVAAKLLEEELNKKEALHVDARGIDFLLWWNARQDKTSSHHMTVTTAY